MTLFTPPCMSIRDRMTFALYDHQSVTLYEKCLQGDIEEDKVEKEETDYLDRLEAMGEEELFNEFSDKIGIL